MFEFILVLLLTSPDGMVGTHQYKMKDWKECIERRNILRENKPKGAYEIYCRKRIK